MLKEKDQKQKIAGYKEYMRGLGQVHFYHMVTPSSWPLLVAQSSFILVLGMIMWMHNYKDSIYIIIIGIFAIIWIVILWLRDVIREGTYEGMHTKKVQLNLKFGFFLFILSEVMFFFGFFFAHFYISLSPAIELGAVWPPVGIIVISPFKLPLLNTMLLLLSGIYVTISHMYISKGNVGKVIKNLFYAIVCGLILTCIQLYEYIHAVFSIADSVYGSLFYMLTGFHGVHVLAGTVFLIVGLSRTYGGQFTTAHHIGFECAVWYWHSVDIVWLFLFIFVYIWGGWGTY